MAYDSLFSKTPAVFVDMYAFTMGQADFDAGEIGREATSQVFFRQLVNNGFRGAESEPLKVPYFVVAGLGPFFEWLDNWKFTDRDAAALAAVKIPGSDESVFSEPYLNYLKEQRIRVSIDAIPEGELAFPDEPLLRIKGPLWQVNGLEAAVLNVVTAQTVWATIASQFWLAAQRLTKHASLFEFGGRRTPEWGGLGSSRSAYLAGWDGSSNMYAWQLYGIPPAGTMAHAFIMVHASELEAFRVWAGHMPRLAVFLVDTYDTFEGIKNAIQVCKELGIELRGIRLDSGDMDYLSRKAREALDQAGFSKAVIMASDNLSIPVIHQIYQVKQAPLESFGIGGNYVGRRQDSSGTAAVMKVAQSAGRDLMKFSNTAEKTTLPGILDVVRLLEHGENGQRFYAGDIIIPHGMDIGTDCLSREILSVSRQNPNSIKPFPEGVDFYRPIVPIMQEGRHLLPEFLAQDAPAILAKARARFFHAMNMLDPVHRQIISPRLYGVGIEESLEAKGKLMQRANTMVSERRAQMKRFAKRLGQSDPG
jgi:nicotinate phosphoribosyltransferase